MRRLHLLHNHISANHLSQDTTMLVHKSYQMTSKKCIKKALLVTTSFALLLSVVGCTEKENTDVTTEITTEYTTVAATEATTTTEEVIQAVEISFTATPETLESEEELIAFLTNREEEIKVILNDEAINELPLEVKTALKEQIKSADIKLDISNISWEVSQSLQNKNSDELRLEAINWIEDYSNSLSSKLSKRCEVKNINIDDNGSNIVYARSSKMALSSSFEMSDVVPVSSEQNITINPRFLLECR